MKFQTKEGNIKDTTKEVIELFEHTLDKKALICFQQYKAEFKDLTTLKNMFLARYNPLHNPVSCKSAINSCYIFATIYNI